jgi:4-hydroxythreonine-4-phosphate dehydrogenase
MRNNPSDQRIVPGRQTGRPLLGLTLGDPRGIGPEVVVKALEHQRLYEMCKPLVIGGAEALRQATETTGIPLLIREVPDLAEARFTPGSADVLDTAAQSLQSRYSGAGQPGGRLAADYLAEAVGMAMSRKLDAVVCGPISPEALRSVGIPFDGPPELAASLTQARSFTPLVVAGPIRVSHVTGHMPLRQALSEITRGRVLSCIRLTHQGLVRLGVPAPRIAVAAINPHAGADGLMGEEERREIAPAVQAAKQEDINAHGPMAADVLFPRLAAGLYDAAVAMYHDQGHIPAKLLGQRLDKDGRRPFVGGGIAVLGLPIVFTCVAHGSAFDIVGQAVADEHGMVDAIELAVRLASPPAGGLP